MGILTIKSKDKYSQVIFVDTPGIHNPRHKLGERMNREAKATLEDSDVILLVVDVSQEPNEEDLLLFNLLAGLNRSIPVVLALNKSDLANNEVFSINREAYMNGIPRATDISISATRRVNLDNLLGEITSHLPKGLPFFPDDQLTDLYEREITADLIREAALTLLRDEIPHGIAIRIDQFTERGEGGAYIEATIFVERESHKPIVVGQGGSMIKKIGSAARKEIEAMSGRKVYLRLNVKVRKNWRNDEKILRRMGF
jgi:GTP-binding protein Era